MSNQLHLLQLSLAYKLGIEREKKFIHIYKSKYEPTIYKHVN